MAADKLENVNAGQYDLVKKATGDHFSSLWWDNFLKNQELIVKNRGVGVLGDHGNFLGVKSILVGAGPSLDKVLPYLFQIQSQCLIIACDAAMKPLQAAGVNPHIVVTLDPQKIIADFFVGVQSSRTLLIAPTIIHPEVLRVWKGKVLFFNKNAPDYQVLIDVCNHARHIPQLTPGGSVLSVGYDLAFRLGCDPLVFIGQDLSFHAEKTHAKASNHGKNNTEQVLLKTSHKVKNIDIFGKEVTTVMSLSTSKEWFQWMFKANRQHRDTVTINATEAGIIRENCKILSFRESMTMAGKKQVNVERELRKILS